MFAVVLGNGKFKVDGGCGVTLIAELVTRQGGRERSGHRTLFILKTSDEKD